MLQDFQFDSYITLNRSELKESFEIETIYNKKVYIDVSISAYEMAKAALALAQKFNFGFVWFKDKAGCEVLWQYSAVDDVMEEGYLAFDDEIE